MSVLEPTVIIGPDGKVRDGWQRPARQDDWKMDWLIRQRFAVVNDPRSFIKLTSGVA